MVDPVKQRDLLPQNARGAKGRQAVAFPLVHIDHQPHDCRRSWDSLQQADTPRLDHTLNGFRGRCDQRLAPGGNDRLVVSHQLGTQCHQLQGQR